MKITITSGCGRGKTLLSAFDDALYATGVLNYNLLTLSSVIPPHTQIVQERYVTPENEFGDKLYVVKAEMRSNQAGKYLGAGIGWYQLDDGRGVFVEHELIGDTKEATEMMLRSDIRSSLTDLCIHRGYNTDTDAFSMEVLIEKVTDAPTSVLVMAIYQSEAWR